jgi:hypothetical protein
VLLPRGGIPPIARRRSRLALTLAEREDISRGIACGSSIRRRSSGLLTRTFSEKSWNRRQKQNKEERVFSKPRPLGRTPVVNCRLESISSAIPTMSTRTLPAGLRISN